MGLGLGYLVLRVKDYGIALLGFCVGGLVGNLVYSMFVIRLYSGYSNAVLVVTIFLFAYLSGELTKRYSHHAIIVSTSIIGSYIAVKGASFFLGGWPPMT